MNSVALLAHACAVRASDIHLAVGKCPALRINGLLVPYEEYGVLSAQDTQNIVQDILSDEEYMQLMASETQEYGTRYEIAGVGRFRVSIFSSRGQIGVAVRVIANTIPSMDELDLPASVRSLTELGSGLVLVTGPNGSGKSTTLAAMIDHIARTQARHIVTLEDPIEFVFDHHASVVHQRELGGDFRAFGDTLKHLVRHNSDVVMVGEMRDLDTIAATLTLAETGHLVFATLHTINAAQTITRIIDAFPADQQAQIRAQLALSLRGIVSQTLTPRITGEGRVAVREILINTPAIATLIRDNKIEQIASVMQTGGQEGMVTRAQSLAQLRARGVAVSPRVR